MSLDFRASWAIPKGIWLGWNTTEARSREIFGWWFDRDLRRSKPVRVVMDYISTIVSETPMLTI
ncbi:hypothetical protein [Pandoraea soli]